MKYEWDDAKASDNLRKHRVDFADAVRVFRVPLRLEQDDERIYSDPDGGVEVRQQTLGRVEGVVLYVVSTERGNTTRLISARRATRSERRAYDDPTRFP